MDHDPANEAEAQPLGREHREKRTQCQAVIDNQQHRRHAESKTQRKGEDCDLRIVREQEGGKGRQRVLILGVIQRLAQAFGRGGRVTPLRHAIADNAEKPARIAAHQHIADHRRRDRQQESDERLAPDRTDRSGPGGAEKAPQLAQRRTRHAVKLEIGARAKLFEINDQRAIKRGLARHRQRRQRRAIQQGQRQQILILQRAHRAALDPRDEIFQPLPIGGMGGAKAAGIDQHRLRRRECGNSRGGGVGHSRFLRFKST
ncbi:hypothetical protein D9M73_133870 [compost metagenome]